MVEKIQIKSNFDRDVTIYTAHIVSVTNIDDEKGIPPFKTSIQTVNQGNHCTKLSYDEVMALING